MQDPPPTKLPLRLPAVPRTPTSRPLHRRSARRAALPPLLAPGYLGPSAPLNDKLEATASLKASGEEGGEGEGGGETG